MLPLFSFSSGVGVLGCGILGFLVLRDLGVEGLHMGYVGIYRDTLDILRM